MPSSDTAGALKCFNSNSIAAVLVEELKQCSNSYRIVGRLARYIAHVVQFAAAGKLTFDCVVEGYLFSLSIRR